MNALFNVLFVSSPSKKLNLCDHYTSSSNFPINAHFEFTPQAAIEYLNSLTASNFPNIIIVDEAIGFDKNLDFINQYRSNFYLFHVDTLLFVSHKANNKKIYKSVYPTIVSDYLVQPFNKQLFMEKVFPHLSVQMV